MAKPLSGGTIDWVDRAAVLASFACMIHCLVLPVVVAALPALTAVLALPASLHLWMLAFAAPTTAIALVHGRAHHEASWPLWLGGGGLVLLALGGVAFEGRPAETPLTVAGGVLLATAHIANWRLRRGHA